MVRDTVCLRNGRYVAGSRCVGKLVKVLRTKVMVRYRFITKRLRQGSENGLQTTLATRERRAIFRAASAPGADAVTLTRLDSKRSFAITPGGHTMTMAFHRLRVIICNQSVSSDDTREHMRWNVGGIPSSSAIKHAFRWRISRAAGATHVDKSH